MKVTYQGPDFAVVDGLLPQEDFSRLWSFFQEAEFRYVHAGRWVKAFRVGDGQPLWGPPSLSALEEGDAPEAVYPTGTGVDAFIAALLGLKDLIRGYAGRFPEDWSRFFCRPYLYPAGAGLSWHTDGRGDAAGAYVFYAHPEWSARWGAELLVDGSEEAGHPSGTGYEGTKRPGNAHLEDSRVDAAAIDHGMGRYVMAKPNRLVLLRRGPLHRVHPVAAAAGDHLRASLTGFFLRPGGRPKDY